MFGVYGSFFIRLGLAGAGFHHSRQHERVQARTMRLRTPAHGVTESMRELGMSMYREDGCIRYKSPLFSTSGQFLQGKSTRMLIATIELIDPAKRTLT